MRDIGKVFELWWEIDSLGEVLGRELPRQQRESLGIMRDFIEHHVTGIAVHPLNPLVLQERPRFEGPKLIEFHLIFTCRPHGNMLQTKISSLYPQATTAKIEAVMREWENTSFISEVQWKHLFRITRDKTNKLLVIVYNLD